MTQLVEQTVTVPASDTDLVAALRRMLAGSPEPLTLSKIRSALPANFRSLTPEEVAEALQRQVAANVLVQYPRYRSAQDRFWDRPMGVHIAQLLHAALREQPLAASELRRKLPDYAKTQAEAILEEEVAQGRLHRHPPSNSRSGPRFAVEPPDPRTFLRSELGGLFARLERLGFNQGQLRQAALEILHDEEWAPAAADAPEPAVAASPAAEAPSAALPAQAPGYSYAEEQTPPAADRPGEMAAASRQPPPSGAAAEQAAPAPHIS